MTFGAAFAQYYRRQAVQQTRTGLPRKRIVPRPAQSTAKRGAATAVVHTTPKGFGMDVSDVAIDCI